MPRSMTGFGAAETAADDRRWQVEIRTVNGRGLKCGCRIPEQLHGIETDIEKEVARHLSRGSVTVTVRLHDESDRAAAHLNHEVLRAYINDLSRMMAGVTKSDKERLGLTLSVGDLLTLPGVVEEVEDEYARKSAMPVLRGLIEEACNGVVKMREAEGQALFNDVNGHLDSITAALSQVQAKAPAIAAAYQDRLKQRMDSMLSELGAQSREEDIIREVAIFAERTDIAEEISRLGTHVEQFVELLGAGDGQIGRTLDFLAQEMLREANTMGSKCQDASMARCIVEIKGAVDRIKEQVQNIE